MKKCWFILGAPQTGKTTFGRELAKARSCESIDTSAPIIAYYNQLTGIPLTVQDKERYRADLVKIGDVMCSRNPGRLVQIILNSSPRIDIPPIDVVICGIRRRPELAASIRLAREYNFHPVTVRIERMLGSPSDNYDLHDTEVDHVIDNVSTIEWLQKQARQLAISPITP